MTTVPRETSAALASLREELECLGKLGLRRRLKAITGPQEPYVLVEGTRTLNFCSNNYLGLANHPKILEAAHAAMTAEGFGSAGSRLVVGNMAAHRLLEEEIANWKGTEAALSFASGYHANVGSLSALAGPEDAVFSDALNHASLIDGARLSRAAIHVYPHLDMAALEEQLRTTSPPRRRIIVSDSVFSMDGDQAPVGVLAQLARRYDAILFLDEAHAAGVLGGGRGLAAEHGVDFQMGTLGKALGTYGAYVASSRVGIDYLIQRARSFIFTTAPPPSVAAAAHAAIAIAMGPEGARLRGLLEANCQRFHEGLRALGLTPARPSHIVPVLVGDPERTMQLSEALLARGIFVQGIRPPTVPEGTSRLRFTLMATHLPEHIDTVLTALGDLRRLLP